MLNSISWQSYWTFIALTAGIYYLVVYVVFYRGTSPGMAGPVVHAPAGTASLSAQTSEQSMNDPAPWEYASKDDFSVPEADTIERTIYSCVDELNAFFREAKKQRLVKTELLYRLSRIIRKYPGVKGSEYQQSLSTVIAKEMAYHCRLELTSQDLRELFQQASD